MKKHITTSIVLTALACAAPVAAQDPAVVPAQEPQVAAPAAPAKVIPPMNMSDIRHHIYVMEGALARAVDYGAKQLNREILAVMPGVFMLEGEARARGVHLDGYGVFFDVRVPMMRQSMVWSLRMMLDNDGAANQAAINELRRSMQGVTDPNTRASLEKAVRQLERQVPTTAARSPQVAPGVVVSEPSSPAVGAQTAAGNAAAIAARTIDVVINFFMARTLSVSLVPGYCCGVFATRTTLFNIWRWRNICASCVVSARCTFIRSARRCMVMSLAKSIMRAASSCE